MSKIKKIILGTVQFGQDYGVSNTGGKTKYEETQKIIEFAKINNINTLDTANEYGNAEELLGEIGLEKFNVISKFKFQKKESIEKKFFETIYKLDIKHLYAYLAHDAYEVLNEPDIWGVLKDLKDKNKIKKIGFSLNSQKEFQDILSFGIRPDIIQIPFNLLDNRFKKIAKYCSKNNIEVHSRSVFLQGLFFINTNELPKKLKKMKKYLNELNLICKKNGFTMNELALNYVLSKKYIDKVLIGVENLTQLNENIDQLNKDINQNIFESIENIYIEDKHLLNPSNWKL